MRSARRLARGRKRRDADRRVKYDAAASDAPALAEMVEGWLASLIVFEQAARLPLPRMQDRSPTESALAARRLLDDGRRKLVAPLFFARTIAGLDLDSREELASWFCEAVLELSEHLNRVELVAEAHELLGETQRALAARFTLTGAAPPSAAASLLSRAERLSRAATAARLGGLADHVDVIADIIKALCEGHGGFALPDDER